MHDDQEEENEYKRHASDLEEEEISLAKRRRRALNTNNTQDEQEEEAVFAEEDEEEEEEAEGEEEEEEDEEEEEVVAAADSPLRRRQINVAGKPPEAGVIQEIHVENFMCHRKFTVKLSRNVNFITGQNGSGKSAILAAIQICLGAGARRTHRARNLKDLVRKDAATNAPSHAKIRVSLLNRGEDAFKPEIYGGSITVERTIALKGGYNGYKLLDENGVEKSRSKRDLEMMLDQLNIQVENPVAVLDQEEAKKFLTGKPEDKYKFFMKATELSRISNTCSTTMDKIDELQDSREKIIGTLEGKKQQVMELKRKYEEHKELDQLKTKELEATVMYGWAYYQAAANEHNEALQYLQSYQEKMAKREEEVAELEKTMNNPSEEEAARHNKVEELIRETQEQEELKKELEGKLRELIMPQKKLEREQKNMRKEKKKAEKDLAVAKQRLEEERNKILQQAGNQESEEAAHAEKLKVTEEKLSACKEKVNPLEQTIASSLRAYEELEPSVQHAKSDVERLQRQLSSTKKTIQSLESSSGDSLAILGQRVKDVFRMVDETKKKGKFRGPVVGPIGHFIKISPGKEDWAPLAEVAIGNGMLDRFVVTNSHDRDTLQSIRQRAGCMGDCGILQIGNNPRYQVTPSPIEGIETVTSVLNVGDDLVFNALIDHARIDQKALGRDRPSTENILLYKNEKGDDAIRGNIKQVYFYPKGDNWQVTNGSKGLFSNGNKKLRQTIGVDRSAAIEAAKGDLEHIQQELRQARSEEARLEREHTEHQRTWNKAKREMQRNDKEIQDLTSVIEETRAEQETNANVSIDLSEFEQDVEQLEQEIENLEKEDERLSAEIEVLQPEVEDTKNRISECAARNEKVLAEMAAANENLTQLLTAKTEMADTLEKKRRKLDKYKEAIVETQRKAESLESDMNAALLGARKLAYGLELHKQHTDERKSLSSQSELRTEPTEEELEAIEPIEPPKEASFYEAKAKKLQEKIAREKEKRQVSREDPEVIYEKLVRAKEDYKSKKQYVQEIEATINSLQQDIHQRKVLWKKMRKHLELTTTQVFDELLSLNQYSGKCEFNSSEQTLDLAVKKGSDRSGSNHRNDVKSLSGGERSYTTMCLLLALGEKLETPFRILDEFDVFLDSATRRLSIQMLIHLAKKKMAHRQFIFITPQDLSFIIPDPDLKVFKLRPPERHATAGGPSQQTLDFTQTE